MSFSQTRDVQGSRPPAAVELTLEGVLAAALPPKQETPVYAFKPLPPGALVPGIESPNLHDARAVAEVIRAAMDDVSPRTRSVTLILPDPAVRVFVLDFDSLPAKPVEVISVLKFRLRKMVPFDVEKAGVSYQILSQAKDELRVLIAVLPGAILEEYEGAVRTAGFEPGAVLPSSLAALAGLETDEPVLAACLSPIALTTSITHGRDLLLYRTLDLPDDPGLRLAEVQKDIAVAAAYFEDKLAMKAKRLYYAGIGGAQEFARWLRVNDPEMIIVDLGSRRQTGAATALGKLSLAGLAGALAGAV
jgi:type IV pilus assembly protein PilM